MNQPIKLKPHHILDILRSHGHGRDFKPHKYGHAVHTVAKILIKNSDTKIQLIIGADEICSPCKHLLPNGDCNDVLHQLEVPISKQDYNVKLDLKLLPYFGLKENTILTFKEYLKIVNDKVPGIEEICTHPKEDKNNRLEGLIKGIQKIGIKD
ncbi:MAG: DUF1284 domain-containing protein [Mariniphaga sp.]|nr:DUF1284 domain-containing protein [Mariniphaga sp.]